MGLVISACTIRRSAGKLSKLFCRRPEIGFHESYGRTPSTLSKATFRKFEGMIDAINIGIAFINYH